MKRDWDLLRKLLTDVEEERDVLADIPEKPMWIGQSAEEYSASASNTTPSNSGSQGTSNCCSTTVMWKAYRYFEEWTVTPRSDSLALA